jgi:hypothetical protein
VVVVVITGDIVVTEAVVVIEAVVVNDAVVVADAVVVVTIVVPVQIPHNLGHDVNSDGSAQVNKPKAHSSASRAILQSTVSHNIPKNPT